MAEAGRATRTKTTSSGTATRTRSAKASGARSSKTKASASRTSGKSRTSAARASGGRTATATRPAAAKPKSKSAAKTKSKAAAKPSGATTMTQSRPATRAGTPNGKGMEVPVPVLTPHMKVMHIPTPGMSYVGDAGRIVAGYMPPPERLAFYGGLGIAAVLGAIDWPVAAAIGIGTMIARRTGMPGLGGLGMRTGTKRPKTQTRK